MRLEIRMIEAKFKRKLKKKWIDSLSWREMRKKPRNFFGGDCGLPASG